MSRRSTEAPAAASLRIDRWLWCTRFFKSRSGAAEAVRAGHVRLNGQRVKAAHAVRPGDVVAVDRGAVECELTVTAIPARRGPGVEARSCYVETPASIARRESAAERATEGLASAPTPGRPDKRTRRLLLRAKERS